ncbi:MAG: glutathione transferase GstA [Novosphingobium sp.]
MRLFVSPFAPNALRVQIIAHEKAVDLELIDTSADRAGYLAINPLGQVPSLERDDGSVLTESLTIAQYLDSLSGAPFLFGDNADEWFAIAMWERRAEMQLFNPGVEYGHHVHPMFSRFMAQFPDFAASLRPRAKRAAAVFADQLDHTRYLTGDRFTAADITACLGHLYLKGYGAYEGETWPSLDRWSAEILARDSMATVRQMIAWFDAPGA